MEKKKSSIYLLFISFFMCLSMFTKIPPLLNKWEDEAKKYMLIWLPFVGAIIGGLWLLIYYLLTLIDLPHIVEALILTLFPFLITGFIHYDGFLDVVDAKHSYRSVEEKIKILKDPHSGSFAVGYGIVILLAYFVGLYALEGDYRFFLLFLPIISRIGSCLALSIFPTIKVSEYHTEEDKKLNILKIIYYLILFVGIIIGSYFLMGYIGFTLIGTLMFHLIFSALCYKSFKGINGDVTGYSLVVAETLSLFVYILLGVLL